MKYKEVIIEEDLSIYDSQMKKINMYKNDNHIIFIEVFIELTYPKHTFLKLIFEDVIEYSFYWSEEYDFYIIESYKLLRSEDLTYYCSLDPADTSSFISENDSAIIRSKNLKAYYYSNKELTNKKEIKFGI